MSSLPLHPALVHVPLALAFIVPILAAGFTWAIWKQRVHPRTWLILVLTLAVLLGAGLVALRTGHHEGERVEAVVPEQALETHETSAEQFLWVTGLTLAVAGMVLVLRRPIAVRTLTVATVLGTLLIAATAVRTGHAGGRLVYDHNAAAAYGSGNKALAQAQTEKNESVNTSAVDRDGDAD